MNKECVFDECALGVPGRVRDMSSFIVMDILERAHQLEREGREVIHLEIGEPDFDTPECIKEAAAQALAENKTHYTHSQGIIELRESVCSYYDRKYGVEVDPDQVIVTQGTSPAMLLLFSCILKAGHEVIISDPGYACYPNFVSFAGGRPVRVKVREEDGFQYRVRDIKQALSDQTRAVMVNSPSNPTGTLLSDERMTALAALAEEKNFWLVSDEIYHGLVYEGRERSVLEFTDKAFVLNGFSKLFAMTGWRLGYLIAPREFVPCMRRFCQNFFISANTPAQWAGIAALTKADDDVQKMRSVFDQRRKRMLQELRELGFSIPTDPTGAFYVLVNAGELARPFGGSSLKLAYDILEKAGVGVTPGIDFGPGAEGYLRFSYANSLENIERGLDRLGQYIAQSR